MRIESSMTPNRMTPLASIHSASIVLDTNFLMLPVQFKIDIFEEFRGSELITFSACIKELEKIAAGRKKDAAAAKIALNLVKKEKIRIVKTGKKADKAIMDYAAKNECAVATNDKKLLKALKNKGIKILRLRQRKFIIGV